MCFDGYRGVDLSSNPLLLTSSHTLEYKKPMDVYQENIKLNQEKAKAS
jgi:hypothetical protein